MNENITLPREVVELALEVVELALKVVELSLGGEPMGTMEREAIEALRKALAAEQPKQEEVDAIIDAGKKKHEAKQEHPGYIIGSHWLETAYSRICAGEAEADVLRDIGLVREGAFLTGVAHLKAENEALRRDAEKWRKAQAKYIAWQKGGKAEAMEDKT